MDIGWTIIDPSLDILFEKPECVLKNVINEYDGKEIQNCIGIQDLWHNVFAIKFPFDVRFKFDEKESLVMVDDSFSNISQDKIKFFFINNKDHYTKSNPTIQLSLVQFFSSDSQCTATIIPPIFELEKNPMWQYIRLISGKMNIYDWHRDVNFAFEWLDKTKEITIKKGETVAYVIFNSEKLDEKFNIIKLDMDGEIKKSYTRCVFSRKIIKRGTRYLLLRNRKQRPKRIVTDGKCPYGFDKLKFW